MKAKLPARFKTTTLNNPAARAALVKAASIDSHIRPETFGGKASQHSTLVWYANIDALVYRLKRSGLFERFIALYATELIKR